MDIFSCWSNLERKKFWANVLTYNSWLQIHKNGSRDMFSSSSFAEKMKCDCGNIMTIPCGHSRSILPARVACHIIKVGIVSQML